MLATGGPAYDIKVIKAYESTPEVEIREYWQFFYNAIEKVGSSYSDIEHSSGLIYRFLEVQKERVSRAVHWYRKSLQEADPLDRFIYIWTGLETLNRLMKEIHPGEVEIAKCKQCGFTRTFEGTAALKKFFDTGLSNVDLYSKARGLRHELLHGYKNLDEIIEEVLKILGPLSIALRNAICVVNGIEPESIEYGVDLADAEDVTIIVYMKFGPFIVDESDASFEEPDAQLDIDVKEREGMLIFHPIITLPFFKSGMGIASIGFDILGRTGYPFKKASVTFSNRKPEKTE